MTRSSRSAKIAALATALAAHGALAVATNTPEEARIEGSSGAGEVRLGNAFADMAAGTLSPAATMTEVTPTEEAEATTARPTPSETVERSRPEAAGQAPPEATARAEAAPTQQAQPQPTGPAARPDPTPTDNADRATPPPTERAMTADPETAEPVLSLAPAKVVVATPAEPVEAERTANVLTAQPTRAAKPSRTSEAPTATLAPTAKPVEPLQAVRPVEAAEAPEPQTEALSGAAPDSAAVTRSLRPMQRSAAFEQKHKPPPAPKKPVRQAAPKKKPVGNGTQNARAGSATGNDAATARRSGSGGNARAAGNAAASNYPGQVMSKISRVGRPRVNARGTAVVSFTIAGSGGLSRVGLARSSGSSALDRAAVQIIRRAAPFPRPPAGAQRRFSINIQGR